MNKVIEVKNLVKEYKGKRAVDDLSFDVYEVRNFRITWT